MAEWDNGDYAVFAGTLILHASILVLMYDIRSTSLQQLRRLGKHVQIQLLCAFDKCTVISISEFDHLFSYVYV